jgi:hypothetical protein
VRSWSNQVVIFTVDADRLAGKGAWPRGRHPAARSAPALTPARTAPPSPAAMPKHSTNTTMSRDTS